MTILIINHPVNVGFGIDLIFFGLILRLYIGRQRFDRAGQSPVRQYRFYWQYLLDSVHELLLSFAGEAVMWLGLYIIFYGHAISFTQIFKP